MKDRPKLTKKETRALYTDQFNTADQLGSILDKKLFAIKYVLKQVMKELLFYQKDDKAYTEKKRLAMIATSEDLEELAALVVNGSHYRGPEDEEYPSIDYELVFKYVKRIREAVSSV